MRADARTDMTEDDNMQKVLESDPPINRGKESAQEWYQRHIAEENKRHIAKDNNRNSADPPKGVFTRWAKSWDERYRKDHPTDDTNAQRSARPSLDFHGTIFA